MSSSAKHNSRRLPHLDLSHLSKYRWSTNTKHPRILHDIFNMNSFCWIIVSWKCNITTALMQYGTVFLTCPLLEFLSEVPLISSRMSPAQMNLSTSAWLPGIRSRTKTRPLRYLRSRSIDVFLLAHVLSVMEIFVDWNILTSEPTLPPGRAQLRISHTPKNKQPAVSLSPP